VSYEGTDHKDDVVVFCDPGLASGIRFSWSMTLAHDDKQKDELLALFRRVVEQSSYTVTRVAASAAAKTQH
jgi:site-specific DNA-adenine methylase